MSNSELMILNGMMGSFGIPMAVSEYVFDANKKKKFRFDFCWPDHKIALEKEGGIWRKGGGAHSRPTGILRDIEKYNLATCQGWRIIRVVPDDLFKVQTAEMICLLFNQKK